MVVSAGVHFKKDRQNTVILSGYQNQSCSTPYPGSRLLGRHPEFYGFLNGLRRTDSGLDLDLRDVPWAPASGSTSVVIENAIDALHQPFESGAIELIGAAKPMRSCPVAASRRLLIGFQ
jgi:hypothetical protein